jgi:DNA-binding PadR family transcriptional regulator
MMFRGHLRFFVLNALGEQDLAGYSLMKKLGEELGDKPSPGTIYPLLEQLKRENLVKCKDCKRKKVYSITKKGKDFLKQAQASRDEFLEKLRKMQSIIHPNKQDQMVFEMIKKNPRMINDIAPDVRLFMNALMHKLAVEHNKVQLKSFLKEKTKELRSL